MKRYPTGIMLLTAVLCAAGTRTVNAQAVAIYNFTGSPDGSVPESTLVMDPAGNLYGTTSSGGTVKAPGDIYGTVFELSPKAGGGWTEKVLYSFGSVASDGLEPLAGVILDARGNLYGTTSQGGAFGSGTVYELSPGTGGTWTEKTIHNFGAINNDGASPRRGSLIFDAEGNLYGTAAFGGPNTVSNGAGVQTAGVVFELLPSANGTWGERILYNFGATSTDAANSVAGLVFDGAGNLFGTTVYGGQYNSGTVFELMPGPNGTWTEAVRHSFQDNGVDGSLPEAGLVLDAQGNLYGTTYGGGSNAFFGGLGAVFELSPAVSGAWPEQVLFSFTGSNGNYPVGGLVFDTAGNLYGTASAQLNGWGLVFELSPSATGWSEKAIAIFGSTTGGHAPSNGLLFDPAGNLYGTNSTGGTGAAGLGGTVYQIPAVVTAAPTFSPAAGAYSVAQTVSLGCASKSATIYYSINGAAYLKYTAPIDVAGSETLQAYAHTTTLPQSQVATASYQIGTTAALPVFSPPAGAYALAQTVTITDAAPGATIYYSTNGVAPTTSSPKYTGPLIVSATETLEALAVAAGYAESPVASAKYTIAPVTPPKEALLYSFQSSTAGDGNNPFGGLVMDSAGNLYGTTEYGGPHSYTYAKVTTTAGTVFELSPRSGGGYTEKVIYDFAANSTDGAHPLSGLVIDKAGNLYGTTSEGGKYGPGTAFELVPAASGLWTEKILYNFGASLADGKTPIGGLVFDAAGNLYGTTQVGGVYDTTYGGGFGTVFELSPATTGSWTEKVLYSFSYLNQKDGYYPDAGLIFDSKGNLYGTTSAGSSAQDSQGGGAVFELSPGAGGAWTQKVLYNFGGGSPDGYNLQGGLVLDPAGNLYGTAYAGGNGFLLDGLVFELSPTTGGVWTEQVLHRFGAFETDGINPRSTLVLDAQGNLYGTTYAGGEYGYGTIFELTPETVGGWTENVLHSFNELLPSLPADGGSPDAGLILDPAGNLFGTTFAGGAAGFGAVFEIVSSATTQQPVISPGTGSYTTAQTVKITDATPNAVIYYTTNGATPTASSAKYTAALTVAANETVKAIAEASGLAPSPVATAVFSFQAPTLTLTPASLTFANTVAGTASPGQAVTIKNNGSATVTLTSISLTGANPASFLAVNNCSATLAAGASCSVWVSFTPATAAAFKASLSVADNASGSPQTALLSGTGVAKPSITLSSTGLAFPSTAVGAVSTYQAVTLTNASTVTVTLSSISITGNNATSFEEVNTCGPTVAPAASCVLYIAFKPTAAGALTGAVTITTNGSASPQSIKLTGTGTA